jgi:hypothetical protein
MKTLALALLMPLLFVGCGPKNVNVTPQATVAHYASDIAQALTTYQALVVKATQGMPPLMTVAQAQPRMDEIRKGLDAGQRLATMLRQYDALAPGDSTRGGVASQIQAALTALSTLGLAPATLPAAIVAEGTRLVANINTVIANAKAALATGGM